MSGRGATSVWPTAVEDYVKVIYGLGERDVAATTTAVATELGVSPSSASAMLTRLREQGLVVHQPYAAATLTEEGTRLALRVVRRRRLIESFLIEALGYSWDEVEREAEQMSRAATDTFIERIADKLGHPVRDPHGDPIPDAAGQILTPPSRRLAELDAGAVGHLVRVWNGNPAILAYLDECGIGLGDRLEVLRREPFGGPLMVRVGEPKEGRVHGFGSELAAVVSVELQP